MRGPPRGMVPSGHRVAEGGPHATPALRRRAPLRSIARMTTRTADVVIIGGGVTGASTAFHLTRRGVRDVVLVDKGPIASGGTGKSSACVRQHYSTAETCRMILYSLDF